MKYSLQLLAYLVFFVCSFTSCNKDNGKGIAEPQGGLLPTNYIIIKDGSFSPANISGVRGSSFTFVNQSGSDKGIYSFDSVVINKQGIANNTSFFFKKDTVGTIFYNMAGKPSVAGSITLTP
jgi:hypothetical protein